jgi:hypothetical protein
VAFREATFARKMWIQGYDTYDKYTQANKNDSRAKARAEGVVVSTHTYTTCTTLFVYVLCVVCHDQCVRL